MKHLAQTQVKVMEVLSQKYLKMKKKLKPNIRIEDV